MFSRGDKSTASIGGPVSIIGADMVISGDIQTEGALHLDGRVTGDIRCASLVQGETGSVHGNIVAEEARLAGLVDGAVEAGSLTLEASARVTGDVLYEALGVNRGAEVEGRFRRRRPGDHGSIAAHAEQRQTPSGETLFPDVSAAVAAAAE